MSATAVDRQTVWKHVDKELKLTLATSTAIPAGVMVCTDASGLAVNGSDTAGLIMQGWSTYAVDYDAGDRYIVVRRGAAWFANNGNVLQAHQGTLVTIVDNQTVGLPGDTVNDIGAGYVDEVNTTLGVLVNMSGGKVAAA
jgi:hypothetical protein